MIPIFKSLQNSNSKSMCVDGSTTPKNFTYTAAEPIIVSGLVCVFKDSGVTSLDKFGALTALSNGVSISTTINGNTTEICLIKDNSDICSVFHTNHFGNGAVLSILGVITPDGFGDSTDIFIGYMDISGTCSIVLNTGDTFNVSIQDDLTNIDIFNMKLKFSKGQ